MSRFIMALAALSALAGCAAAAETAGRETTPSTNVSVAAATPLAESDRVNASASCEIRATPIAGGVRLEPVVLASTSLVGEYQFNITKIGASGSSDISQGGPFQAGSGNTALGGVEVSLTRRDRYRATLILSAGDSEICRSEQRS